MKINKNINIACNVFEKLPTTLFGTEHTDQNELKRGAQLTF